MSYDSHVIDMLIKSQREVDTIHEYSIDTKTNYIYMFGEEAHVGNEMDMGEPGVTFDMANRFIKNLHILMRKSTEPIVICMKSIGGDYAAALAMYDAIKSTPNPITILNYSSARSATSIIFQAANKRVMMPNSYFMYHHGSTAFDGTCKQFVTYAEWTKYEMNQMVDIYVDRLKETGCMTRWSKKRIKEWLEAQMNKREEVYLTSDEAVRQGFADEVFGSNGVYNWKSLTEYTDEQLTF